MVNEIIRKIGCGWCNTNDHEHCVGFVKSYDTIWICGCKNDGCGVTSARNTARVGAKPRVPSDPTSVEQTVLLEEGKTPDVGVLDAHRESTDERKPVARRGRTKKPAGTTDKAGS